MSFQAEWEVSGTTVDVAGDAFTKSAQKVIDNLKKHEDKFNKIFKENITTNMRRSGVDADNFADAFELRIGHHNINFINTAPLVTQRYEYGYYDGSKDTNEEYYEEYMVQTSPRYFIRPAIQETLNEIGHIMLEEAKKEYNRNHERNEVYER